MYHLIITLFVSKVSMSVRGYNSYRHKQVLVFKSVFSSHSLMPGISFDYDSNKWKYCCDCGITRFRRSYYIAMPVYTIVATLFLFVGKAIRSPWQGHFMRRPRFTLIQSASRSLPRWLFCLFSPLKC